MTFASLAPVMAPLVVIKMSSAIIYYYLTGKLKEEGGHGGYAILPSHRNKGYGKILLKMLIDCARDMKIDRFLLTVQNHNTASIKVALANNGRIEKVDNQRHFIWIDC